MIPVTMSPSRPAYSSVLHVALNLADALREHLACGLGRDSAKVLRRVIPFANDVAVFVELLGDHPNVEGLVDDDVGLFGGIRVSLVRGLEPVGEGLEQHVGGNPALDSERLQRFHHVWGGHEALL